MRWIAIFLGILAAVLVLLAGAMALFIAFFSEPIVEREVGTDGFREMLSEAVSKALKVEGKFSPLTYDGSWTIRTDGYESTGLPGEAIGGLNASGVTGTFDPWAVFRRVWQMDTILIESGEFILREPDDALKREPPEEPRPWYAWLMPQRFHVRWIDCPQAQVTFPFGGQEAGLRDIHIGATMIGRNFNYFAKDGDLDFPFLPAMRVDALQVYVTREMVEVGYAYLREPDGSPGRAELSGRLGQRDDKSIRAKVMLHEVDLAPMVPEAARSAVSGRVTGSGTYETNREGKDASGSGEITLQGAKLRNWDVLDRIANEQENPSLRSFDFETFAFKYEIGNDTYSINELEIDVPDKLRLSGNASFHAESATGQVDATVDRMPLAVAMPAVLENKVRGDLSGTIDWEWTGIEFLDGHGGGSLKLASGRLSGFDFQEFLARFLRDDRYLDMSLREASLTWARSDNQTELKEINVLAPNEAGVRGSIRIGYGGALSGTVLAGLRPDALKWLPDAETTVFSHREDGLIWARVNISGTMEKPEQDLVTQITEQIRKHPLALAALAARGLSWWLGDLLGTAPKHSRD